MKLVKLFLAGLIVIACGGASLPPAEYVSRAMMGADWPLTVDGGALSCRDGDAVVFTYEHVDYGVNGSAGNYADIGSIWAPDPSGYLKKSIAPLITRGLALCPK